MGNCLKLTAVYDTLKRKGCVIMGFSYGYEAGMGIFSRLIAIVVALMGYVTVFGAGILLYAIQAYGLSVIAKRRGLKKPWLAWIPVCNMYLLGSLSDQYQYVAKGRVRNRRKVIAGLSIAVVVLGMAAVMCYVFALVNSFAGQMQPTHEGMIAPFLSALGVVGILELASLILVVFQYISLYDLYRSCEPNNSVAYLILSILFPAVMPILVFLRRSDDKGMPPRRIVVEE